MSQSESSMIAQILSPLEYLRLDALAQVERHADDIERANPVHRVSAMNLLHYVAMRQHDLRTIQTALSALGLSSLGRSEAAVLAALELCIANLRRLAGIDRQSSVDSAAPLGQREGSELLRRNANELLGHLPPGRERRIMVTVSSAAASDPALVHDLVEAGMDVMRINTAHDGPEAWTAMLTNLQRARAKTGRDCLVQFDLAGPKPRTGDLEGGDRVIHWRPKRNRRGEAMVPASVLVVAEVDGVEANPQGSGVAAILPINGELLARAEPGDVLRIEDLRGRKPELRLVKVYGTGAYLAEGWRGAYIETGARVQLRRGGERIARGRVGLLPCSMVPIDVRLHDRLILTREQVPGRPGQRLGDGRLIEPARIPASLAEAFVDVRPGERLWIDDGKIGCVVERGSPDELLVKVDHAPAHGYRLRPDKGINLPDSTLSLPSLTAEDLQHLDFVVGRADLIGMSFVRTRRDVEQLLDELQRRDANDVGIVLKIETRQAFQNLPDLLLTGMRWPKLGIMVARGDLAVEIGFERLAEVQEEILWLCEAAHVPVIWATQVLDSLARNGNPTRAEVTDAAMSGRAECVMLNKGPYVVDALRFLVDVSRRMTEHQEKKRSLLRQLAVSHVHSPRYGLSGTTAIR